MSKLKRPVFKYKIEQFSRKNMHSDVVLKTAYRVLVKDNSFYFNNWLFLTPNGQSSSFSEVLENARSLQGFYFDDLNAVRDCIDKFRQLLRKDYETSSYTTLSKIEHGSISIYE